MEPTYHHLQLVILEKQEKKYEYNDVIVFWCDSFDAYLVKRIVACPGDRVYIKDGVLYVNGCINEYYQGIKIDFSGIVEKEIILSSEEYFVLGDNVAFSKDSRYIEVGLVNKDTILGKVLM